MIIILYYPDSTSHCAIALTGLGYDQNFYLSFMPNDVSGSFRLHKMEDDFKHRATQIVNIPSEESCGFGLSEQAILKWYTNEFIKNSGFNHFNYNCSTVVYEALKVGQIGAKSLGNNLIERKNWFFDLPYKILNFGQKLADKVQTMHMDNLKYQDNWLTNKILEMENLYNTASKISKNEFIYSYFIKSINQCVLEDNSVTNDYQHVIRNKFIGSFLKTLRNTNFDKAMIKEIEKAFKEKDQDKLLKLSQEVYNFKFNEFKVKHKSTLSFFNVNKFIKLDNYTKYLRDLIDDCKNLYNRFFEKQKYSTTVIGNHYRVR